MNASADERALRVQSLDRPWRSRSLLGRIGQLLKQRVEWFALLALGALAFYLWDSIRTVSDVPAFAMSNAYSVGSPIAGVLIDVTVQPGQRVKQGQVLGRLDSPELLTELAMARVKYQSLHSLIASTEAKFRMDQASIGTRLKGLANDASRNLAQGQIELKAWRAEHAEISAEIQRLEALQRDQVVSVTRIGELKAKQKSLAQMIESTPKLLDWHEKKAKEFADLQKAAESGGQSAITLEQLLTPIRQERDAQALAVKNLEAQKEKLVLRAPIDGFVVTVLQRKGDPLPASATVLKIEEERPSLVTAYISETAARRVRIGSRVTVHARAPSTSFFGIFQDKRVLPGKVIGLGDINTLPVQHQDLMRRAVWVRAVTIKLDGSPDLIPGERLIVAFR